MGHFYIHSKEKKIQNHYEDMFNNCDTVVSTPRLTTFIGNQVGWHGGVLVRVPVDIRTHVGLKQTAENGINIKYIKSFDPQKGDFIEEEIENKAKIIKEIRGAIPLIEKIFDVKIQNGFDISILTQLPLERRMAAHSSIVTSFVISVLAHYNKFTEATIKEWRHTRTEDLVKEGTLFSNIFRVCWEIVYRIRGGRGAGVFCSLLPSKTPIIFLPMAERRWPRELRDKTQVEEKALSIRTGKYTLLGYRMEEFVGVDSLPPLKQVVNFGLLSPIDILSYKETIQEQKK